MEEGSGKWIRPQLPALVAFPVGVEDETSVVDASEQHHSRGRAPIGRGCGHCHRLGHGLASCPRNFEPPGQLGHRIGIDGRFVHGPSLLARDTRVARTSARGTSIRPTPKNCPFEHGSVMISDVPCGGIQQRLVARAEPDGCSTGGAQARLDERRSTGLITTGNVAVHPAGGARSTRECLVSQASWCMAVGDLSVAPAESSPLHVHRARQRGVPRNLGRPLLTARPLGSASLSVRSVSSASSSDGMDGRGRYYRLLRSSKRPSYITGDLSDFLAMHDRGHRKGRHIDRTGGDPQRQSADRRRFPGRPELFDVVRTALTPAWRSAARRSPVIKSLPSGACAVDGSPRRKRPTRGKAR